MLSSRHVETKELDVSSQRDSQSEEEFEPAASASKEADEDDVGPRHRNGRQKVPTGQPGKRRMDSDENDHDNRIRPKGKAAVPKEPTVLERFIKIIDYLKKIQFDENSIQNKMNPYHALTPNCFWYMVSAEYFSYDFNKAGGPTAQTKALLNDAIGAPFPLPNRIPKVSHPYLNHPPKPKIQSLVELIDHSIHQPIQQSQRVQPKWEKSSQLTTPSEDDEFISSIRTIAFNHIMRKLKGNESLAASVGTKLSFTKASDAPLSLSLGPSILPFPSQMTCIEANSGVNKRSDNGSMEAQNDSLAQNSRIDFNAKVREIELTKHRGYIELLEHPSSQEQIMEVINHLPLDKLISILQACQNTIILPQVEPPFMPAAKNEALQLISQLHEDQRKFLKYLKELQCRTYHQKQAKNDNLIEQEIRENQTQDAKCQICTDGDYTDDNLIVFCSLCGISLHQRCIYLTKVPTDSWICDVCEAFGPAGPNVPCPLCNVKGGAMRRTTVPIGNNCFRSKNPQFYKYSRKFACTKQKEKYQIPKELLTSNEQGFYDYFCKATYPTVEPTLTYIWVHYVCALWVPECYFQEKNGAISVQGLFKVQQDRFKKTCFVCRDDRCGACIKCQQPNCNKYYHAECGRRRKVYMEQLYADRAKYLIFCEEHEPLKLIRQIQYRRKKGRQEINKFARMISKYIETYKIAPMSFKLIKGVNTEQEEEEKLRVKPLANQDQNQPEHTISQSHKVVSAKKVCLEELVQAMQKQLMKVKSTKVIFSYDETGIYCLVGFQESSTRKIKKCLNRHDQFWSHLTTADSAEENYKAYQKLISQPSPLRDRLAIILRGIVPLPGSQVKPPKDKKAAPRRRNKNKEAPKEQVHEEVDNSLFCICRLPYQFEKDMFECDVCEEWYHFKCVGFKGGEEEALKLQFHCMQCMRWEDDEEVAQRWRKYGALFESDAEMWKGWKEKMKLKLMSCENQVAGSIDGAIKESVKPNKVTEIHSHNQLKNQSQSDHTMSPRGQKSKSNHFEEKTKPSNETHEGSNLNDTCQKGPTEVEWKHQVSPIETIKKEQKAKIEEVSPSQISQKIEEPFLIVKTETSLQGRPQFRTKTTDQKMYFEFPNNSPSKPSNSIGQTNSARNGHSQSKSSSKSHLQSPGFQIFKNSDAKSQQDIKDPVQSSQDLKQPQKADPKVGAPMEEE